MTKTALHFLIPIAALTVFALGCSQENAPPPGLWQIYNQSLKNAKYIDLTHTITPTIPVWKGFGPSRFPRL